MFEVVNRVSTAKPQWVPRINRLTSRVLSAREYTTASHEVFASPRDVRFREMEYAVPREAAAPLLRDLQAMIDRSDLRLPFPVEVRFTAEDDVWLSTAYGRATCYIAVHQYHRMDHQPYFSAFEEMAQAVGGRPHWGKLHGRTATDLRPAYPQFDAFLAVRNRVDPDRLMANDYLGRVLGE